MPKVLGKYIVRPGVGSGNIAGLGRGSVIRGGRETACAFNCISYFAGLWEPKEG